MSYGNGNRGHGYGNQQKHSGGFGGKGTRKDRSCNPFTIAKRSFEKRTERAQSQDLKRIATLAPNIDVYLEHPERYDYPFVDTPESQRQNLEGLCKLACNEPVEINIKDSESRASKKLRVVRKEAVKGEVEKELLKLEQNALAESGPEKYLPSEMEIYEEAVRLWQKENAKPKYEGFFDNVAAPTKGELSEEGYLRKAQLNLMTKDSTQASRKVDDYLQGVRSELNRLGFDVVPISGFDSTDLQF